MVLSNSEVARRGFEAVLEGDVEAVREFLHPDVKWHGGDPTAEGGCLNREQALEFMRAARARNRGAELEEVIAAGDKVVLIIRRPSPEGGTQLTANLTTFQDGKAIEMVAYPRPEDALAAVGIGR